MSRKSLEYWATPASKAFEEACDDYELAGFQDGANGLKPSIEGVYGTYRTMYFLGYRKGKAAIATAA